MCKEEIYININISFLVSEFLIFVCGIQYFKVSNKKIKVRNEAKASDLTELYHFFIARAIR